MRTQEVEAQGVVGTRPLIGGRIGAEADLSVAAGGGRFANCALAPGVAQVAPADGCQASRTRARSRRRPSLRTRISATRPLPAKPNGAK